MQVPRSSPPARLADLKAKDSPTVLEDLCLAPRAKTLHEETQHHYPDLTRGTADVHKLAR